MALGVYNDLLPQKASLEKPTWNWNSLHKPSSCSNVLAYKAAPSDSQTGMADPQFLYSYWSGLWASVEIDIRMLYSTDSWFELLTLPSVRRPTLCWLVSRLRSHVFELCFTVALIQLLPCHPSEHTAARGVWVWLRLLHTQGLSLVVVLRRRKRVWIWLRIGAVWIKPIALLIPQLHMMQFFQACTSLQS